MLTVGQLIILTIATEVLIWDVLKGALSTIRHCATVRAYRKSIKDYCENDVNAVRECACRLLNNEEENDNE